MALRTRSQIPTTGTITGGTDQSGDANINDELDGLLGLNDGTGDFDVAHKQSMTANDAGGDFDSRIKGQTDDDTFVVDASTDSVGVGTATPLAKLHVDAKNDTADAPYAIFDSTSVTPADNDKRSVEYKQRNDGGSNVVYAKHTVTAVDVTSGTEKGKHTLSIADGVDGSVDDVVDVDIDGLQMLVGSIKGTVSSGVTASTTQTQGQQPLTSQTNEISVVANDDDTVTLPPAAAGLPIKVINNGANRLQVFPDSGDNLGGGLDTSTQIEPGQTQVFEAIDSTNWEFLAERKTWVKTFWTNEVSFDTTTYVDICPKIVNAGSVVELWPTTAITNGVYNVSVRFAINGTAQSGDTVQLRIIDDNASTVIWESVVRNIGNPGSSDIEYRNFDLATGGTLNLDIGAIPLAGINRRDPLSPSTRWTLQARRGVGSSTVGDYQIRLVEFILEKV